MIVELALAAALHQAPTAHQAHIAHLRHGLHVVNTTDWNYNSNKNGHKIPSCREEDGSGQFICYWNAQTSGIKGSGGQSFLMRVVVVYANGDVKREYTYAHHNEYLRESF
jgi:hypothetical protein